MLRFTSGEMDNFACSREKIIKNIEDRDSTKCDFLFDKSFNDTSLFELSNILESNKYNIRSITILYCSITDIGIERLFKALESNNSVKVINLQWRGNGLDGGNVMNTIVKGLGLNTSLRELSLDRKDKLLESHAVKLLNKILEKKDKFLDFSCHLDFDICIENKMASSNSYCLLSKKIKARNGRCVI